jgi:hypothetical protein
MCLCFFGMYTFCSHVARKQCTQGAALQVLMPWVTRPQDIKAVQQAGHKVARGGRYPSVVHHAMNGCVMTS